MVERTAAIRRFRTRVGHAFGMSGDGILPRVIHALLLSNELWIMIPAAYLCGRAGLGREIFPFGLAFYWTVLRSEKRFHTVIVGLVVLLGMAGVTTWSAVLAAALIMIAGLVFYVPQEEEKTNVTYLWGQAILVAVLHMGMRLLFGEIVGNHSVNVLWLTFESLLLVGGILIWQPLTALKERMVSRRMNREAWIALGLFGVMLSLGLSGFRIGPVEIGGLWNRLITLAAALLGRAPAGAAVGTAVSWVAGMGGAATLSGVAVYGIAGLLGGLFASRGRLGVGAGFLLGHLLITFQTPSSTEIVYGFLHATLAVAAMAFVPKRWIQALERMVPGSRAFERLAEAREEHLREEVSERLRQMGNLFAEMGRGFEAANPALVQERSDIMATFVTELESTLCGSCPSHKTCWSDNLYQTYWDMVDFVARASGKETPDLSDLPRTLRNRCVQPRRLLSVSAGKLQEIRWKDKWQRKLEAQQQAVPRQLLGLASLMKALADQVQIGTGRADEIQVTLSDAPVLRRWPIQKIDVRPLNGDDRFEISLVVQTECDRTGSCAAGLADALSSILDAKYILWSHTCAREDGTCYLRFVPRPKFDIVAAMTNIAKGDEDISGDSANVVRLPDGRVIYMLSDGMGSGHRAAIESQSAVQMMARLLEAGFDLAGAIQSVNSFLLLRSTETSFATLDVVVVDQFTGEVDFLKVGSSPSFIRGKTEVNVVRSATAPIGILAGVDVRPQKRRLEPGDMVVMMTDGVLDSIDRSIDREEWIARLLRRCEANGPEDLMESLLERVQEITGESLVDDVSMIVLQMVELRDELSRLDSDVDPLPVYRQTEVASESSFTYN